MLGKLIKHEFDATWRVPVALEAVLIVLGIMGAITLGNIPSVDDSVGVSIIMFLLTAIYYVGIIAANIVTMVYLVMRYYRNLYTSQGYLTFTLPVRTDQIITAKVVTGWVWMLLCFICTILSVMIAAIGIISQIQIPVEDFQQIMTIPENALTKQYQALLAVDKVLLTFDESAIAAIAEAACNANENHEDIGARRLHAVFEQLLEDVLFNAGDEDMPPFELKIDDRYVNEHLKGENKPTDIRKFIL